MVRPTVAALSAWAAQQPDPIVRSGGLVVLGSLAHRARDDGDLATADEVDGVLRRNLALPVSNEQHLLQLLEAVGNAGCDACVRQLVAHLQDRSANTRAAAVGALRFVATASATAAACDVLDADRDLYVRERAAWALGWNPAAAVERVNCLVRAAARDQASLVRVSATNALAKLAQDLPCAREALLQLTDAEYGDAQTRAIAFQMVAAFPPRRGSDVADGLRVE